MLARPLIIAPMRFTLVVLAAVLFGGAPQTFAASPRFSHTGSCEAGCITEFELPRPGSRPFQLVIGPDDALWFTEKGPQCGEGGGQAIGRLDADGTINEHPVAYPSAIVVGPDGAFWFGQQIANTIGRLTTDGALTQYSVPSSGTLRFRDCVYESSAPGEGGILVGPDGNLWFSERTGNKIARMALAGHIDEFGVPTPDSGPLGMTVGPDGAIWFIERQASKVGRITMDGAITEYPIPTADAFPNAIAVGPDNAIWFTELMGDRVGRMGLNGDVVEYPADGLGPVGMVVGPDKAFWLAGYTSNEIARMTLDGVITNRYPVPTPNAGVLLVALGPDRSIWFTEDSGNKIGRLEVALNDAGAPTQATGASAPTTAVDPAAPVPLTAVAVEPVGNPHGLVDIGSYRLYIECQGQGSPTIVLDAGFNGTTADWVHVQPEVARFSRVCAYDRANRGRSDTHRSTATALQLASDLHALLASAHVDGPYVLVGQSFGGLVDRMFASRYPSDMAGLVLVDAVHENYYGDGPGSYSLPPDGAIGYVDLRRSAEEARSAAPLPDIPLVVLARGHPDRQFSSASNDQWPAWQLDLSTRAPQGRLVTVPDSGHNIQFEQPAAVVDAIRNVVAPQP